MKQILKLIVAILFMAVAVNSYAAKDEDITLIVTSDGATKDEAIKNALRNAIEQTYGVFVSANTDILNDDIVKDEIATVSTGNIKKYTELSSVKNDDGTNSVTVEAIVSVGKLINYAKSKGAECDLDGASMFQDIQLQQLYKINEEKAIENLIKQMMYKLHDGIEYTLQVGDISSTQQEERTFGQFENSWYVTRYNSDGVSIPYKVCAYLNETGVEMFAEFYEALANIGKMYFCFPGEYITDPKRRKERENTKKKYMQSTKHRFDSLIEKSMRREDFMQLRYSSPLKLYTCGTHVKKEYMESEDISRHYREGISFLFRSPKSIKMINEFWEDINVLLKHFHLELTGGEIIKKRRSRDESKGFKPFDIYFKSNQPFYRYIGFMRINTNELNKTSNIKIVRDSDEN